MERGRSASAGRAAHIKQALSTSPHSSRALDPSGLSSADLDLDHLHAGATTASATAFVDDPSFTTDYQAHIGTDPLSLDPSYSDFVAHEQRLLPSDGANPTTNGFLHANLDYPGSQPGSNHVSPHALSSHSSPQNESIAFPAFGNSGLDFGAQDDFAQDAALDPSLLSSFDASSSDFLPAAGAPLNSMATVPPHSPTPPHLLQPDAARSQSLSHSPSPHASPSFQAQTYQFPGRPRNASETLFPASALQYGQGGGGDYNGVGGGNSWTHRRTPSDAYSDMSSHSNQASPFLTTMDSFEGQSSPLLQADPQYNNPLGLDHISLTDQHSQSSFHHHSPRHTPSLSPRLIPEQQPLPTFTADDNFGLNGTQYVQSNQLEMFPAAATEPFPAANQSGSPGDFGHADQMSPPEISIDYAAPQPEMNQLPPRTSIEDNLSPPLRTPSRNRMRAKSDPYAGIRTPSVPARGRSPSLQPPQNFEGKEHLSPLDAQPTSRSPSPGRGRNGSVGSRNRSSSNASDKREYLLDLADPQRGQGGGEKGRVQKHPATFQCHLCEKRFTRAYNLRSHLRTHTDERPFVCTVCGKAFARQHDRKRHEGLHSGEKKFVCKGVLQSGPHWGCGRRFARADALGRHFRSEAGRVCIKPLLDEEAAERRKQWMAEQQQQHQHQQHQQHEQAQMMPPPPMMQSDMLGGLPQALLQQYPALAGLDWNAMAAQGPVADEELYSGRSSFDASSGGEYYEDVSDSEMGEYGNMDMSGGGVGVYGQQQQQQHLQSQQQPDYLASFEGR